MARKLPQQGRSVDSTARMLDAAEEILMNKGEAALTVQAIIDQSKTSMGAFYARFESRDGLLIALHERFISEIIQEVETIVNQLPTTSSLEDDVSWILESLLGLVRKRRPSFYFFVIRNSFDEKLRNEGRFAIGAIRQICRDVIAAHVVDPSSEAFDEKFSAAWLMAYGYFLQLVLYNGDFALDKDFDLALDSRSLATNIAHLIRR